MRPRPVLIYGKSTPAKFCRLADPGLHFTVPQPPITSHGSSLGAAAATKAQEALAPEAEYMAKAANRHNPRVETRVTHSKQTTVVLSNRHKFEGAKHGAPFARPTASTKPARHEPIRETKSELGCGARLLAFHGPRVADHGSRAALIEGRIRVERYARKGL
jgi:hypothetical protein